MADTSCPKSGRKLEAEDVAAYQTVIWYNGMTCSAGKLGEYPTVASIDSDVVCELATCEQHFHTRC